MAFRCSIAYHDKSHKRVADLSEPSVTLAIKAVAVTCEKALLKQSRIAELI
jgi:hypothetical protein